MGKNEAAGWLEDIPDRNPILSRGLHTDILAVVSHKPLGKAAQVTRKCGKTLAFIGGDERGICSGDTGHHKGFVDINTTTDRVNDLWHRQSPQKIFEENRQGLDVH
jgi:hypothetical protein